MWIRLSFAAVYLFWSSTYLGIHFLLRGGFPPFFGAGMRMAIAGAVLGLVVVVRKERLPTLTEVRDLAIAAGFLFVGGNGLVMVAQQYLPSGVTALLIATTPFWLVGLEALLPGGERPTRLAALGIAVGFVGVVLLVEPRLAHGAKYDGIAAVLCLLASLTWAIGTLWVKHRLRSLSSLSVTAYEMLFASVFLLLLGLLSGEPAKLAPTGSGVAALAYLVVFGSLVGFSAFVYLVARVPAAKISTYSYVNPVLAMFLGWALANEEVTSRGLMASAVALVGVAMVTFARLRAGRERA